MDKEQLGKITLIHGDCMDYMRTLPDNAFELAIVDPPYGINVTKMDLGNGKNRICRGKNDWHNWFFDTRNSPLKYSSTQRQKKGLLDTNNN